MVVGVLDAALCYLSYAVLLLAVFAYFCGGLAWILGAKKHAKVLLAAALLLAALGAYWSG